MVAVWVSPSHSTVPPKASATNRNGARVLLSTMIAGWSMGTTVPLTVGDVLPTVRTITVLPFVAVTVCVAPFHSTCASIASNMARSGTIVLPPISCGGTSKERGLPLRSTEIAGAAGGGGVD